MSAAIDVVEVNAPLGLDTAARVAMVAQPWRVYRLPLRLARCWARLIRAARGQRGRVDAVVVGYLGQFDVLLARALFPRRLIVLDQLVFGADTAADRGLGRTGGLRHRLLGWLDRAAVTAADIVLVDTIEDRDLIDVRQRGKAVVVAVGADHDWLRAGRPARRSAARRAACAWSSSGCSPRCRASTRSRGRWPTWPPRPTSR